ncbi:MAG: NRDE family protein [Kofleriaceae bacterium]
MCTIAFLVGVLAEAPLVLAANRDELYERPTRPPEPLGPHVVGGVDALSGGTWLAVRRDGRFAGVTNQRALVTPPPGLRSRGLAVKELALADDPDTYVRELDPTRYASMNLAWGDARGVSIAYLRQDGAKEIVTLERGVHVLCNDKLGALGFPRCERLEAECHRMIAIEDAKRSAGSSRVLDSALAALAIALGDDRRVPLAEVAPSEFSIEIAHAMTATCIRTERYGTRSSTLFASSLAGAVAYRHADGPPNTTPFADRLELLS